jgi:hypothetical protein
MSNLKLMRTCIGVGVALVAAGAVHAGELLGVESEHFTTVELTRGRDTLPVGAFDQAGRIRRLFGRTMAEGVSPEAAANAFMNENASVFGVDVADLRPLGPFPDDQHTQPIMFDRDRGRFKFTGVYYTQYVDDIPVYNARATVLVRNEPGHPVVLVSADLHNLAGFAPDLDRGAFDARKGVDAAQRLIPNLANFTEPELVIWAGVDEMIVEPRVAHTFVGDNGLVATASYAKWRFVTDAKTGEILHQEDLIHNIDVEGNVSAWISPDHQADACTGEVIQPLPYARVAIGSTIAFADINGDFVIPNDGGGQVTVSSQVRGQWFRVNNEGGSDAFLSESVLPPGPVNFVHNVSNSEFTTAEVNCYFEANIIRDDVLEANPLYPVIWNQEEFPINVNLNNTCNAFYDGSSINFFRAGGGCNNTGFGDVVHHEYGHHLVQVGGSGQGQYGEGMSDVMGLLVTGRSELGVGFDSCFGGIRDADNNLQYPCNGGIHFCGQLLSGCVWDLLEELEVTEPDNFREIVRDLAVNSILLHSGSGIAPDITVDFLTLDDDDETIFNGTPHYDEIAAAFGAHNMDAPELALLDFQFPNGLPSLLSPDGQTVRVLVGSITADPEPGTGMLFYTADDGTQTVPMIEIEPNVYDALFPPIACGSQVEYFFSAETTDGGLQEWPPGAPGDGAFDVISAFDVEPLFTDDFEQNLGWTVSGSVSDGAWERGVPAGGGDRGDPAADADDSGQCFVTDNVDGNSDVDGGTTILTSPLLDASAGPATISYWRWYSNTQGDNPMADTFVVEISDDGGATWETLEVVGPSGPEVDGGWFNKEFLIADFVDLTDQIRVRFSASDLGGGSIVEAGVDGVELTLIDCTSLPEDLNGDGVVDVTDLLALLAAWGPCADCPEDIDGSGAVDVTDLLAVLAAWG